jgi:hypothetical protein
MHAVRTNAVRMRAEDCNIDRQQKIQARWRRKSAGLRLIQNGATRRRFSASLH